MKNKKLLIISIFIMAVFIISGCGKKELTVTFDPNGGSGVISQKINKNTTVNEPSTPTRDGYKFLGWYDGETEWDFSNKITEDIKLTAKWEKTKEKEPGLSITKYTVTFDSNGGSTVSSQEIVENEKVIKPTNPTKDGYTFVSWKKGTNNWDFDTKVTENVTLVAEWKKTETSVSGPSNPTTPIKPSQPTNPTPSVSKVTITFNSNGGSNVSGQTITKGSTVKSPTNPTKIGYKFIGWTLNGEAYNFSTKVIQNITLVARWEPVKAEDKYTISYAPITFGSDQMVASIYKNGTLITNVIALLKKDDTLVGKYNPKQQKILIASAEISEVVKAKLSNNTIVKITK